MFLGAGISSSLRSRASVDRWLRQRLSYPVEQIAARVWLSQDKSDGLGNVDRPRGIPSCNQNLHARSLAQSPLAQFQSVHVVGQIDIGEHKVDHEFRLQRLRSLPSPWRPRKHDTRTRAGTPPCPSGQASHLPRKGSFPGEQWAAWTQHARTLKEPAPTPPIRKRRQKVPLTRIGSCEIKVPAPELPLGSRPNWRQSKLHV